MGRWEKKLGLKLTSAEDEVEVELGNIHTTILFWLCYLFELVLLVWTGRLVGGRVGGFGGMETKTNLSQS